MHFVYKKGEESDAEILLVRGLDIRAPLNQGKMMHFRYKHGEEPDAELPVARGLEHTPNKLSVLLTGFRT